MTESNRRNYQRDWRRANKDRFAQQNRDGSRRWRAADPDRDKRREREGSRLIAKIKLDKGCADCGYREHHTALQFDHVSGIKLGQVSMMKRSAWHKVLAEIAKCEVVCANCHAIRTFNRLQEGKRSRLAPPPDQLDLGF